MPEALAEIIIFANPQASYALGRTLEALLVMGETFPDFVYRLHAVDPLPDITSPDNPRFEISFRPKKDQSSDHWMRAETVLYCDSEYHVATITIFRGPGQTSAEFHGQGEHLVVKRIWGVCQWCGYDSHGIAQINRQWQCRRCHRFNP